MKRTGNKYIAVESMNWDYEYFDTQDSAEDWIKEAVSYQGEISEDSHGSFVAEIVSTLSFPEKDNDIVDIVVNRRNSENDQLRARIAELEAEREVLARGILRCNRHSPVRWMEFNLAQKVLNK
jgi:hypothetical protein